MRIIRMTLLRRLVYTLLTLLLFAHGSSAAVSFTGATHCEHHDSMMMHQLEPAGHVMMEHHNMSSDNDHSCCEDKTHPSHCQINNSCGHSAGQMIALSDPSSVSTTRLPTLAIALPAKRPPDHTTTPELRPPRG